MVPIFITGIGTDIGKTVVAAIVTQALQASYWKPVQAGFDQGTDSQWISERITRPEGRVLPETYKLILPASPHIAARSEGVSIDLDRIERDFLACLGPQTPFSGHQAPANDSAPSPEYLVIEGAGGLFVPLNDKEFVIDLVKRLAAPVILVSRNYLGSINHSLMTAALCKEHKIPVAGWIFNDQYLDYEAEIAAWTGLPSIASIPHHPNPDAGFIAGQAEKIRASLVHHLRPWQG